MIKRAPDNRGTDHLGESTQGAHVFGGETSQCELGHPDYYAHAYYTYSKVDIGGFLIMVSV